jgi:hypothetical protein
MNQYQIRIIINPNGVKEVNLQTDGKDQKRIEALAFYAKVSDEIERFRKNISKILKK